MSARLFQVLQKDFAADTVRALIVVPGDQDQLVRRSVMAFSPIASNTDSMSASLAA